MAEQWYLRQRGNEIGPLAEERLIQLATDGQVMPNAEIRKEGTTRWVTAIRVKGLFPESLDAPPVAQPPQPDDAAAAPPTEPTENSGGLWAELDLPDVGALPEISAPPSKPAGSPPHLVPSAKQTPPNRRKLWIAVGTGGLAVTAVAILVLMSPGGGDPVPERSPATVAGPTTVADPTPVADPATAGLFPASPSGSPTANPVVSQTPTWRNLQSGVGTQLRDVSFVVDNVWTQQQLSTPAPESADQSEKTSTTRRNELATASNRRYLFIQLSVRAGANGLRYASWNGGGERDGDVAAQLVDAEGNRVPLVPLEKTPAEERQGHVDLQARAAISDLLVFELPVSMSGELRLRLPQQALGLSGPALQFRLSPSVLASGPPANQAPPAALAGNPLFGAPANTTPPGANGEQPSNAADLLRNVNGPSPQTKEAPREDPARPGAGNGAAAQRPPIANQDKPSAPKKTKPKIKAPGAKAKRKPKSKPKRRIENKFNPF